MRHIVASTSRRHSGRCGLGALIIATLIFCACDSGSSGSAPSDLEGAFVFTRFELTVDGVDDFDFLRDTLAVSDRSPRMEFFGGNAGISLIYRLEGSAKSSVLSGQFGTLSGKIVVDVSGTSEKDRFQLLLPSVIQLRTTDGNQRLLADQPVKDVNLRKYAPGRYAGLTQNVNGTLHLRLERNEP